MSALPAKADINGGMLVCQKSPANVPFTPESGPPLACHGFRLVPHAEFYTVLIKFADVDIRLRFIDV
jgi:hypothetical protein